MAVACSLCCVRPSFQPRSRMRILPTTANPRVYAHHAVIIIISIILILIPALASSSSSSSNDHRHDHRHHREMLDTVEKAFLGMLGLSERPRPHGPVHIPQRLKELYEQLNHLPPGSLDKELNSKHNRNKRSVDTQTPYKATYKPSYTPPGNTIRSFYFNGKFIILSANGE